MEGWRGGCREGCRDRRKDARRDGRIYAQLWVRGGSPTEDTRSSPHNGVTAHSPAPLPAPAHRMAADGRTGRAGLHLPGGKARGG